MRFVTRDREAGNEIERFEILEEARKAIEDYEKNDRAEETFTENFYEIYDSEREEIVG